MKHRLKGLLALVLSLTMVFALATNAWAAVWIDNVELKQENNYSVKGTNDQGTATYDPDTNTLTLNGFAYSDTDGIRSDSNLIIKLIGVNSVTASDTASSNGATAITVYGNLTIKGDNGSSLTASGTSRGIDAGNVTIESGKVTATGGDCGIYVFDPYSSGGTLVISGGSVEAYANDGIGIYAPYGEIAIGGANNPTVEVGCATGLSAFTVNILENSTVTITTNATAPAVGKAIDATTLNFGRNWYQWSTNNPGETTPISSETKAFALNNYGGTGQNPAPTSLTIGKITYTVTFDANGHGTAPTAQTVASGATASEPTAPTADGWTFGGWYKEAGCSNAFDFNTAITGNITLYAKWTENSGGVPGNQQPSYNYPIYIPTVEDEPEGEKVTSSNTFDGGIASAVVVTILSATGGAWLAKKKD